MFGCFGPARHFDGRYPIGSGYRYSLFLVAKKSNKKIAQTGRSILNASYATFRILPFFNEQISYSPISVCDGRSIYESSK